MVLSLWLVMVCMASWQIIRERDFRREIVNGQLSLVNGRVVSQIDRANPTLLADFLDFIEQYYRQHPLFSDILVTIYNQDWEVIDAAGRPISLTRDDRRRLEAKSMTPDSEIITIGGRRFFCNASASTDGSCMVVSALPDDKLLNNYLAGDRNEVWIVMFVVAIALTIVTYFSSRYFSRNIDILRDFAKRSATDPDYTPGVDFPHDELGDIARQIVTLHNERQHAMIQLKKEHSVAMHAIEDKSLQKRQLTNNINHELKTPIGVIKGYLDTLVGMPDIDEETRNHFIAKARDHANRLVDLIADVSAITRLEEGAQLISTERINYHDLVYTFAYDIRESGALGHIEFTFDLPLEVNVRANSNLLTAMLMNLAKNSANYSCGTTCTLEYLGETGSGFYRFCFYDDGIGVPDESLEHIFDRFYRVDVGRSRKTGGTGLGLAIVYNTINAFGGTVKASNRPDAGFQITFTLPKWSFR